MGDVKMLAMMGAFLGWPLALLSLMIASVAGTIIGLALIVTGRGHPEIRAAVRHLPGHWRRRLRSGRAGDSRVVFQAVVIRPIFSWCSSSPSSEPSAAHASAAAALDCDHFTAGDMPARERCLERRQTMWS